VKVLNDNKKQKTPNKKPQKNCKISSVPHICEICNKGYKYNSGLSRHKSKSHNIPTISEQSSGNIFEALGDTQKNNMSEQLNDPQIKDMILDVMQQNKIMYEQLLELSKEKQYNQTIFKNCGNKQMTINVFLNEECKNAINLTDFMSQIHVNLEDLMYTKDNGYVQGLGNIFIKHLQHMKPTERPIHCSDTSKLHFYVKDDNMWNQDNNHVKIDKSIQDISLKQIQSLKLWEQDNPNYLQNDKLLQEWHTLVQNIMCSSSGSEGIENHELIKKQIGTESEINDSLLKNDEG
jgi:uncharacterized protein YneR